jgi:branched-chain amino acid transport system ATP-binding protein
VRDATDASGRRTTVGDRGGDESVPCLALDGVTKRFGSLAALDRVSLSVRDGEQRAVIGPNGAGKTTLFDVLAGDLSPSEGRVFFQGRDVTALPSYRRARMGICRTFQTSTLFESLTVLENVVMATQADAPRRYSPLRSRWAEDLVEGSVRLLQRVGLEERLLVPVGSLSHGEQRQVEILLAASGNPTLLMLDEPAAGLASADLPLVTDTLRELCSGVTMILIEHDMSIAFGLAESVTVLHHGSVVADGTVEEVRSDPRVQEVYLGGAP